MKKIKLIPLNQYYDQQPFDGTRVWQTKNIADKVNEVIIAVNALIDQADQPHPDPTLNTGRLKTIEEMDND